MPADCSRTFAFLLAFFFLAGLSAQARPTPYSDDDDVFPLSAVSAEEKEKNPPKAEPEPHVPGPPQLEDLDKGVRREQPRAEAFKFEKSYILTAPTPETKAQASASALAAAAAPKPRISGSYRKTALKAKMLPDGISRSSAE